MTCLRARVCAVLFACLLCVVPFAVRLAAQAGSATLTGSIVDAQGGALPGATVTVTEQATTAARTLTSDRDGVFRIPALAPGRYHLDITMEGFSPLKVTDVSLAPAEVKSLDKIELAIGQISESVVVAATAAVQTATSSRMGTVTAEQLTNIQMKGRDVWGMLAVIPGVQDTNMNRSFTTWTSMAEITINGSPNTSKVVIIDGVNVIDELGTQAQVNPNIDAVGEVQVISSGYTAENGRSSGGLIIMTTKSGTLQLYNIFNTAQFTNLDTALTFQDDPNVPGVDNLRLTNTTAARYIVPNNGTGANPPREFGLTIRLDF